MSAPLGNAALTRLAQELGRPLAALTVLSHGADPFSCGTPAHFAHAEWFAALWRQHMPARGGHLRRLHYRLVVQASPVPMVSGAPYLNTTPCWSQLPTAELYEPAGELAEIRKQLEPIREQLKPIAKRAAAWSGRGAALYRIIADEMREDTPDFSAVEWPEPAAGDEHPNPLFDSKRDYLEQIDAYKAHQGRSTERRARRKPNGGAP